MSQFLLISLCLKYGQLVFLVLYAVCPKNERKATGSKVVHKMLVNLTPGRKSEIRVQYKAKKLLVVFSLQNWKDCFPLCLESTVKIERGGFSVVRQSQRELHQQGDSWFSLPTKLSNAISFCQSHFQKTGFLFLYLRFGIWPDFPTLATFFNESFEILKPLFTLL